MAFCKYCGKELVDGKCDCAKFIANMTPQVAPQPQVQPQAAPQPQVTQSQPQGQPEMQQPNFQQNAQMMQQSMQDQIRQFQQTQQYQQAQSYIGSTIELIKNFFSYPVSTIKNVVVGNKGAEAIGIGIFNLVVLFLTVLIHLPIGEMSKYVETGYRARIALIAVVGCAIFIVVGALIHLLVQKVRNQYNQYGFVNMSAALCLVTFPSTLCFILGFVFGFFAIGVAIACYVLSLAVYIRLSFLVYNVAIDDNEDNKAKFAVIVSLIVMAITAGICYFVLGSMLKSFITDLAGSYGEGIMGGLGGLGGLGNLMY